MRASLGASRLVMQHIETFLSALGQRAYYLEPLTYASAWVFERRGFDACTVDDIAEAADVSPRTFFRYFAVKEDVALACLHDHSAMLIDELNARPASEPPLTALREALRRPLEELKRQPQLCGVLRMVEASPSLLARQMAVRASKETALADALAGRMGVDAKADIRPRRG